MALEFHMFFPDEWGVDFYPDDNLLDFCSDTKKFFEKCDYLPLEKFGVIPVVTTESKKRRSLAWNEHITFSCESSAAAYVYINSRVYRNALSAERIVLLHNCVKKAVKMLSNELEFDYEAFEKNYNDYWEKTKQVYEEWKPPRGKGRPKKNRR